MTRRILAIDTSGVTGSLALAEDGRLVDEIALDAQEGFGQVLFGQLERLLARRGWRVEDAACIAVATGPGSFTGVRVALSAAKGLAHSTGACLAPVSNLRAIAWHGKGPLRAAFLDARRGEVYGGVYDAASKPRGEETVMPFAAWTESLPSGVDMVSPDAARFEMDAACMRGGFIISPCPPALAPAVAMIGWRLWQEGATLPPEAVEANYVRRSDAELSWKENR